MKKLKFFLGFAFGLMFCIIPNVNADTNYETVVLDKYEEVTTEIITSNISSKPFKNYGSGHLIFSFVTYTSPILPVLAVYADTSTQSFTCNIGNFSAYDNTYNDYAGYTVDCPVNFGSSGLTNIIFEFPGVQMNQKIQTSYNMTFVSNDSNDLSQLLSVVNQLYTDMGYGFSRQYIQLGEIYDRIGYGFTQSNELNQKILDALTESDKTINDIKDGVNDLNENITNDNVEGVGGSFESFEGFISENSTITQLITMPITLYSSILNGLQSTCQPFVLGNLFGTNLTLPCINIGSYLGSTLWSMLDIIISGFAIFAISKKFIKIFNNFSSMKEGDVIDD